MNTVDALNVLGKAPCGDSFEVKPGLTDAETILEIAKNYTGGSGGGERSSGLPEINISFTSTYSSGSDTPEVSDFVIDKTFSEINELLPPRSHGSSVIVHAVEKIVEEGYDDEIMPFTWVMTRRENMPENTLYLYNLNIGSDDGHSVVHKNAMVMIRGANDTVSFGGVKYDAPLDDTN